MPFRRPGARPAEKHAIGMFSKPTLSEGERGNHNSCTQDSEMR
jgi:hypothetical protein